MNIALAMMLVGGLSTQLNHTKWKLVAHGDVKVDRPFTLSFDHSMYQHAGCNSSAGRFRIGRGKLILSEPRPSTRKACAGEAQEVDEAFSRLPGAELTVEFTRDRLILTERRGTKWVFAKSTER